MTKIKVSRQLANFIDDYARNMSHDENWKDELLINHSIMYKQNYINSIKKAKVLQDIAPMKLAEILHNGYEVEKYTVENLPKMFKFTFSGHNVEHTSIICEGKAHVAYEHDGEFLTSIIILSDMLGFLNKGVWTIIE